MCFSSCGKPDEPVEPTPPPTPVEKDTKAPEIVVKGAEVNVYGGKAVKVEAGRLTIGETEAATWSDDKSSAAECSAYLTFSASGSTSSSTVNS